MVTAVAWSCIAVGVLMVAWWTIDLRQGAWNRGVRRHEELGLHLAAEFLTAGLLMLSGMTLLIAGEEAGPLAAVGLGMLLYTTIVSPGYFLARRELLTVGMFAVLITLTMGALLTLLA